MQKLFLYTTLTYVIFYQKCIVMPRIILIIMVLLISGCSEWSLKRSANNKLIDTKGFEGSKRRPLYNKKYINRAKRNIVENNYEEEDDDGSDEMDEISDPASANRSMYKKMTQRERKIKGHQGQSAAIEDASAYPKLGKARSIVDEAAKDKSQEELQREIAELKKMMVETKKDLAKQRCPNPVNGERQAHIPQPRHQKAHSLSSSMGVD